MNRDTKLFEENDNGELMESDTLKTKKEEKEEDEKSNDEEEKEQKNDEEKTESESSNETTELEQPQQTNSNLKTIEIKGKKFREDEQEGNILKLEVNERILMTKEGSEDFTGPDGKPNKIFHVRVVGDKEAKRMFGTTILNQVLGLKENGSLFVLERLADKPSSKGSPLQVYKTYSPV